MRPSVLVGCQVIPADATPIAMLELTAPAAMQIACVSRQKMLYAAREDAATWGILGIEPAMPRMM